MKEYIHYGCKNFDPQKIKQVKNRMYLGKPSGGFWSSPIESEYSWKQWNDSSQCSECREDLSVKFYVKNTANILEIHNLNDAQKIIDNYPMPVPPEYKELLFDLMPSIDWEKISKEYDGVEIFLTETPELNHKLPYWDCDSLVIFNGDCIEIIDKDKSVADNVLDDDKVEIPFVMADEEEIFL